MARVQLYQATNFHDIEFWYGEVEQADASRIVISDGSLKAIYKGNFSYDAWGEPYGVLTGYEVTDQGTTLGTVEGISVDANEAYRLIESGDSFGLMDVALRGADTVVGSKFSDTLDGFAGNDRIYGGGGNDDLWGDVGNDYIDGGAGVDTAFFLENLSDYVVTSFSGEIAVTGLGAEYGTDLLVDVERLNFLDADIIAPSQNFDALEYTASYRDLINAFGDDAVRGFYHYAFRGVSENRGVTFDSLEYIASHRDLINAFGANADNGAKHYINYGAREGRETTFDSLEYIASHRDLINAFGTNADNGAEHYINYGVHEGRSVDLFDAEQYLDNYADLQVAFGENTEAATRHYIQYGAYEGRTDDALNPVSVDEFLF